MRLMAFAAIALIICVGLTAAALGKAALPSPCRANGVAALSNAALSAIAEVTRGAAMKDTLASDVALICARIMRDQAAIALANQELRLGRDPRTRNIARRLIAAKHNDIAVLLRELDGPSIW